MPDGVVWGQAGWCGARRGGVVPGGVVWCQVGWACLLSLASSPRPSLRLPFIVGVVGSQDKLCPGFAPDVELHTFKVGGS